MGGFGRAIYLSCRCVRRPGDVTRLSSYYRPYYDSCAIETELSLKWPIFIIKLNARFSLTLSIRVSNTRVELRQIKFCVEGGWSKLF